MACIEKDAMEEYLKELTEVSNLYRKEYGTVMSLEANENGVEKLLEISWRAALQRYFDETCMHRRKWQCTWPTNVLCVN